MGLLETLQLAPGHSLDLTTIQKKGPVQLEVLILTWDKIFKIDFVESVKFSYESGGGGGGVAGPLLSNQKDLKLVV